MSAGGLGDFWFVVFAVSGCHPVSAGWLGGKKGVVLNRVFNQFVRF